MYVTDGYFHHSLQSVLKPLKVESSLLFLHCVMQLKIGVCTLILSFSFVFLSYNIGVFLAVAAVLLWLLTAACIKTGRPQIARKAIELAESRLLKDSWPEYYDGKLGRYIGKQARKYQTWSIAGYLVAKMMLEDPSHLGMISLEEDKQMKPLIKRSSSWTCWEQRGEKKERKTEVPKSSPVFSFRFSL